MNENHKIKKDSRTAILLVTPGTTRAGAQDIMDNCADAFTAAYPDAVIRFSIASELVRQLLRESGDVCRSPIGAITELMDEGFSRIILQPLYVTPSHSLQDLYSIINTFNTFTVRHGSAGIDGVLIGKPLLMGLDNYRNTADALISYLGTPADNEALVFVSCADETGADSALCQLQMVLDDKSKGNIVVGAFGGYPGIDRVKARLKHINASKVTLVPLAMIPGKHSEYEIGGGSPESWKSVLESAGYEVSVSEKILAQSEEIAGIFIESISKTGKSHGFL